MFVSSVQCIVLGRYEENYLKQIIIYAARSVYDWSIENEPIKSKYYFLYRYFILFISLLIILNLTFNIDARIQLHFNMKSNYLELISSYVMIDDPTIRDLADDNYGEHLETLEREQPHTAPHGQGRFIKRKGQSKVKKNNSEKSISVRILRSTFKRTTRSRKSSTKQLKDFIY